MMSQSTQHPITRTVLFFWIVLFILVLTFATAGCRAPLKLSPPSPIPAPEATPTPTTLPQTSTPSSAITLAHTPTPKLTPIPTLSPTLPPIFTSTPTSTLTSTPFPTPSPTPTSSLSSTPTPSSSPLAQAQRALDNGDYPAAIAAFNTFLAEHPEDAATIEANLGLARAWLAAKEPQQAIPILDALARDNDTLARHPEIMWWLGDAYRQIDPQRSAQAYLRYAQLSSHLTTDAYLAAADVLLAAGDTTGASEAYAQALNTATNIISELRAREGLAETAMLDENPQKAVAQYQAILAKAQSPAYRAEILYRLGEAQEAAGWQKDAWQSYQQATQAAPDSWYAYQALIKLVEAGQPVDDRLRARIDISAGAYAPAIDILTKLLANAANDTAALQALLAQAYEGLQNYAAAADVWQQLLSESKDEALRHKAWLGLGRSLWRQGKHQQAREIYLQAAEQARDPEVAATALWWAAVLAGQDEDKWLQAADDFARLAQEFPQSDYADQAGFRAGLIYYRLGDYETARALWHEHASHGNGSWQAAAHFWLGKILIQEDRTEEALTHWQNTARKWNEDEFYGVRARQMLQAAGITPTPTPTPPLGLDVAAAKSWAAQLAKDDVANFAQTPPQFERISELHDVGEDEQAHRELESLRQKWADAPIRLLQLSLFAQQLRYYDISIRAASRLVELSHQPLTAAPRFVQELTHPLAYNDLIMTVTQNFELDPALFYALVRQESLFWAPAVSHVGASGLTQIMPATGRSAAAQLGLTDFTLSDLHRPHMSLYLGAYILSQELQNSDGNPLRALAAYNAGPGNAYFWWQLADHDPDLFVELISFRETQRYVRTITIHAHHYRRLYPQLQP